LLSLQGSTWNNNSTFVNQVNHACDESSSSRGKQALQKNHTRTGEQHCLHQERCNIGMVLLSCNLVRDPSVHCELKSGHISLL
jgi:ABC-type phosphate/phosphonate transport system ATPase subunit